MLCQIQDADKIRLNIESSRGEFEPFGMLIMQACKLDMYLQWVLDSIFLELWAQTGLLQGQGMRAAEMLVWLGDFNYRVNCSYEDAKDYIQHGWIKELLSKVALLACLSHLYRKCRHVLLLHDHTY